MTAAAIEEADIVTSTDEDERFRHAYAVLDDCPETWLDKKGYYKGLSRPSEWVTHGTELSLGLINLSRIG